nr:reverse transcriptase domain-containing protein [Tanacetum cinerariifolium]
MYPRFLSKCLKMGQFGQITHTHTYAVPFHTRKVFTTLRVNSHSFLGRTVPFFPSMLVTMGEGSGTPTEPHHTPSPKAQQTSPTATLSQSLPPITTVTIPNIIPTDIPQLRQYTRRARIAQSSALLPVADEPASPIGDGSQEIEEMMTYLEKMPQSRGGGWRHERKQSLSECSPAAEVATVSGPPATISVPTGSDVVPTASPIFTTDTVTTPYSRRKEMEKDAQRINEQVARDAEIARIHTEEELQIMIDGLDRNNETVAKYLQEYEQFAAELSIRERIELISDLVKYQDNYAKVLKYQTQQKEIREKFDPVWKQIQDFVPMGSKEEGERFKRKGLSLEQDSAKKLWALVKETLSIRSATSDKKKELWVELKRLYEPDVEDQLWTQTKALMHDPVEWRLYDSCGIHHILSRDQEIFIRSTRLQIVQDREVIEGILFSDEFPLPEEVPTASEEKFPLLKKRDATAEKFALLMKTRLSHGLPRSIEGKVTTSKPQTLEEAIDIAQRVMDQYRNTNTNNRYNNYQPQQNQRQEAVKDYAATPAKNNRYAGNFPFCKRCTLHHTGPYTVKCNNCNKVGHLTKNCQNKRPATGCNQLPVIVVCHACGEKWHYTNQCQKTNINARGRGYLLRDKNAHQDPNVVTEEKRLEDIPVVKEFPDIFPEDLPGLPPIHQVEFQINLIPGTTPIHIVQFLDSQGLHVDPAKIKAVKNWETPTTPTELRQFLGLTGYY